MKSKIKVLIADDHTIVRIGLTTLLNAESDIEVVGEARNGEMAVKEALRLTPDIVVMDLMMPKKDGAEATAELHERLPSAKVIILTTFGASDGIAHALESGAAGALMKTADDAAIVSTIRAVAGGRTVISADIKRLLANDPPVPTLTPRQLEVLSSMTRGLTNRDIANQLGICIDRVNDQVAAILTKIGAANRTEAVAIALRKHLFKI
ncbi:MAG: response regulator transcription factor [Kiritimatiellae bacterium]|nr:response regulator transcription factor [Kiritimatiellia bacterium]MBQ3340596.1 response regulator transcription factor [Kiritimatiellia bacterium]MBQ6329216.1 response regulator transcription factor [Kiritimatiellia bacterium]